MDADQIPDRLPDDFFEKPFTARALKDFAQCPRKFLLSRFVPREETRRFLGSGAILHQALRRAIIEAYRAGPETIVQTFDEHFEGHLCKDSLTEENLRRQGHAILDEFVSEWMNEYPEAFETDLMITRTVGERRFRATAELVFQPDETDLLLVRLNSSRRPPTKNELAEDLSALLLHLLAKEHYAPQSVQVAYYCLRPRRLQPVEVTEDRLDYLRRDLQSRVRRIEREREFPARPYKHCRWCRARGVCEAWK